MAKEYNITKTAGRCAACEKVFEPEQLYVGTVRDGEDELFREDFCEECWPAAQADPDGRRLGVWRGHAPKPQEKKRLFVDDDLMVNLFRRLEGTDEPAKINFRFVLGLVLMRKKLLMYDRSEPIGDGRERWSVRLKGSDESLRLIDPKLDEARIAEVGAQLGQILEGEL